jgi:hypothetical protein
MRRARTFSTISACCCACVCAPATRCCQRWRRLGWARRTWSTCGRATNAHAPQRRRRPSAQVCVRVCVCVCVCACVCVCVCVLCLVSNSCLHRWQFVCSPLPQTLLRHHRAAAAPQRARPACRRCQQTSAARVPAAPRWARRHRCCACCGSCTAPTRSRRRLAVAALMALTRPGPAACR